MITHTGFVPDTPSIAPAKPEVKFPTVLRALDVVRAVPPSKFNMNAWNSCAAGWTIRTTPELYERWKKHHDDMLPWWTDTTQVAIVMGLTTRQARYLFGITRAPRFMHKFIFRLRVRGFLKQDGDVL